MSADFTSDVAFESLRQFAVVWHDKYPQRTDGENRKPPSLTMRAAGVAAVLTEPQLGAVVAEYVRMREEVEQLLSGSVPRSLSLALACVACHDCIGVFVRKDILDCWAMDNGWRDGLCPKCQSVRNEGTLDA